MIRVGVVGASGYAGGEVVRYLLGHPEFKISYLSSETYQGKHLGKAFPSLLGQDLPLCESFDESAADKADAFFLAQSNGLAMNTAPALLAKVKKVVDMSADFRFREASVYEEWYKTSHLSGELAKSAVYGLPEVKRELIKGADLVANPGCYPTSALLAVTPALSAKLIDPTTIIVDSKSGVSGAGRTKFEVGYMFSELDESIRPYGVGVHRHTPEIEQEISEAAGTSVKINFTPHLVPMIRGILTIVYSSIVSDVKTDDVLSIYKEYYKNSPFVVVLDDGEYPATKNVTGSNYAHVAVKVDPRTNRLICMSAIDNMGKGSAGEAVQNMNLMFGLLETMGLTLPSVYP